MIDPVIIKLNPDPEEYEEAETEFLAALGLCVTQWAFVDRQLFRLFNWGMQSKRPRAAAIYYRQNSLDQRVKMVTNVFEQAMTEDDFNNTWKPILKVIQRLIPTRNIIVHQPAKRLGAAKDGKAAYIYSIHIEPYELVLDKEYPGLLGKEEILIEDLNQHADSVFDLKATLEALVVTLKARP